MTQRFDPLEFGLRVEDLAQEWEGEAEILERSHPDGPAVRTLRRCARELRSRARELAPGEVPLRMIRERTGWSESWLLLRVRDLESKGRARKVAGGWLVDRQAALEIPRRGGPCGDLEAGSLSDLAERILFRSSRPRGDGR